VNNIIPCCFSHYFHSKFLLFICSLCVFTWTHVRYSSHVTSALSMLESRNEEEEEEVEEKNDLDSFALSIDILDDRE
jgi:hypothetical protein